MFHSRTLISRSGVTDYEVQYVAEEKDLFVALLLIIRKWDPDILIGYEVQMFSWGFLLERALTFEIDLCSRLARVQGSSSDSNMDAEKDRWGAAHTSEIKIAGRIILNVWRLMRHEVGPERETKIKTDSIRKLSNFNFQWTKIFYQNSLKHIAFFFTVFKGYRCN